MNGSLERHRRYLAGLVNLSKLLAQRSRYWYASFNVSTTLRISEYPERSPVLCKDRP
jgi:hypothetical protein